MTSPDSATPVKPLPSLAPGTPIEIPKSTPSSRTQSPRPAPRYHGSIERVTEDPLSRSSSFVQSQSPGYLGSNGRRASSQLRNSPASARSSSELSASVTLQLPQNPEHDDIRSLIVRSFAPHIAVYASPDADELAVDKGCRSGLRSLLRPFGDKVQGKVVIRDSIGTSKGCDDYSIRFCALETRARGSWNQKPPGGLEASQRFSGPVVDDIRKLQPATPFSSWEATATDEAVKLHLDASDDQESSVFDIANVEDMDATKEILPSPLYSLYLSRLLSIPSLIPHETFSHPVTCVIAVSSRNISPIEELRGLYANTTQGEKRLPSWVNQEYLRYYLFIHDEDRDDIVRSTALFQQMKRHFGLNCHLLRLRSIQCLPSDDDSIQIQPSQWITSTEDLASAQNKEVDVMDDSAFYLVESDAAALRSFVRELVTQSVVPFMEHRVAAWNDQVASRRRGISGRFISLSKRWTVFGSNNSKNTPGSALGNGGASGNYDSDHGFYQADAPEAILRKLADFSFMLRDWKFALNTYDLLKNDFNNDKAWMYLAGVNEMSAVSLLLLPPSSTKSKYEALEQSLDTALYSYATRCSAPYGALRCLILCFELMRTRNGSWVDDAAKWASRILEMGLVGEIGTVLFEERMSACYASREDIGGFGLGARHRKAAMWGVLAADAWVKLERLPQARKCMVQADALYDLVIKSKRARDYHGFDEMQAFLEDLRQLLYTSSFDGPVSGEDGTLDIEEPVDEEPTEVFETKRHRRSIIGAGAPYMSNTADTGPLGAARSPLAENRAADDDFE
ncbi:MAG: hypothetical protein M1834_005921 [Cirrosporium novae-zelandiae]|nr:MAG: hypothetical protein M1834_005921 [Cirrosporium novae-zelandiae]